jgi:ABC-type multidrug transport system fused ATPase/permease subunit
MVMQRLMADQSVQRTMLIVSHRTGTLKDVDRVVVFDQGRLVDDLTYA